MAVREALDAILVTGAFRGKLAHDFIPSTRCRRIETAGRELDRVADLIFVLLHSQPPIRFHPRPLVRRCLQAARALPPLDAFKGLDPSARATGLLGDFAILRLD